MAKEEEEDWLPCPNSVKNALPKKIEKAVAYALDECFLEKVGTPEAQRDKPLYKMIKNRICTAMDEWIEDAIDEAIGKVIK